MAKPPAALEKLDKRALLAAALAQLTTTGVPPGELDAVRSVDAGLACTSVMVGALVDTQDDKGRLVRCFVLPAGEGLVVGKMVSGAVVVTPSSRLGAALLGRIPGETVQVAGKNSVRNVTVTAIQ